MQEKGVNITKFLKLDDVTCMDIREGKYFAHELEVADVNNWYIDDKAPGLRHDLHTIRFEINNKLVFITPEQALSLVDKLARQLLDIADMEPETKDTLKKIIEDMEN